MPGGLSTEAVDNSVESAPQTVFSSRQPGRKAALLKI
jgi:hypothetical protein